MKNMIVASTSTTHGGSYLQYLFDDVKKLFKGVSSIVFIPYARPGGISLEVYTKKVREVFSGLQIDVRGIHEFDNATEAIEKAEGIFVGGGNTFVLMDQLYRHDLMTPIRSRVHSGIPYLGTSAGSNICGLTMNTTNDMPIVQPKSFKCLGLLPFNINPHYLDPDPNSTHMGETREMRIAEFHEFNTQPVVGLREGSWLDVKDGVILLKGSLTARVFEHAKSAHEVEPGTNFSSLN